jgi:hypothetical protein
MAKKDATEPTTEDLPEPQVPGDEAQNAEQMRQEAQALELVQAAAVAAENAAKGISPDNPNGSVKPHDLAGLDWRHLTLAEAAKLNPTQTVLTKEGYLVVAQP